MIAGIDEVGRGCLAGPVCVAATVLPEQYVLDGLNDSKLVSISKRNRLELLIKQQAVAIGIGWVSAKEIDDTGISPALKKAACIAMAQIDTSHPGLVTEIIIDGTIRLIDDDRVTTLIKADQLIPAASAASIIAKVARDRYMADLERIFPGYGFARHAGYGTKYHLEQISDRGPCMVHRFSFAPLKEANHGSSAKNAVLTSGRYAEQQAAVYLEAHKFTIEVRNWRTKWCEIDIVAMKRNTVYFVEVKYRKTNSQGDGADYVTKEKQSQMTLAARMWMHAHSWSGDAVLSVIELTGADFSVSHFYQEISVA